MTRSKSTSVYNDTVSRFNGENIAGAAFLFFSFLLMMAGQVNAIFGLLYPVYYILSAAGVALLFIGYRTWRSQSIPHG